MEERIGHAYRFLVLAQKNRKVSSFHFMERTVIMEEKDLSCYTVLSIKKVHYNSI